MKNIHGIEVKKCCASCRFKDLTRLMTSRFCMQHHKSVRPKGCCKQWEISDQLEAAGSAGGKVKCKAYLKFANNFATTFAISASLILTCAVP